MCWLTKHSVTKNGESHLCCSPLSRVFYDIQASARGTACGPAARPRRHSFVADSVAGYRSLVSTLTLISSLSERASHRLTSARRRAAGKFLARNAALPNTRSQIEPRQQQLPESWKLVRHARLRSLLFDGAYTTTIPPSCKQKAARALASVLEHKEAAFHVGPGPHDQNYKARLNCCWQYCHHSYPLTSLSFAAALCISSEACKGGSHLM